MIRFVSILFVVLYLSPVAFAETGLMCPISGEKANNKITYAYQGKTYSFCCPKCIKEFKKNPEKYLQLMASQPTTKTHVH